MLGLNEEQLDFFRKVFSMFTDNQPSMNSEQLELVLNSMDYWPTSLELDSLMSEIDINRDKTIDFEEFLSLVLMKIEKEREVEMKMVFREFDRDGSWQVTEPEFKQAMAKLGFPLSSEEVSAIYGQCQLDKDRAITYQEFCKMMLRKNVFD